MLLNIGKGGDRTSKLDMSLDSIIQKEKKHKEHTGHGERPGHGHGYGNPYQDQGYAHGHGGHGGYEVTEEDLNDPSTQFAAAINPYSYNKSNKYQKGKPKFKPTPAPEGEGEGDEPMEQPRGGYKGKNPNPFYGGMGGYMPPGGMYGGYPPMYGMDQFGMMPPYYGGGYKGGYKPKKFKNMSLVVNKEDKSKGSAGM